MVVKLSYALTGSYSIGELNRSANIEKKCNSFLGVSPVVFLLWAETSPSIFWYAFRYRDEELELGEVVNFQIPVELDAGRRWLEAGRPLVSRDDPHLPTPVESVRTSRV